MTEYVNALYRDKNIKRKKILSYNWLKNDG